MYPSRSASTHRKLAGWSKKTQVLKRAYNFWYKVWSEAGCPSSGVLFEKKRNAKQRYKSETRRQEKILRHKLASSFSKKKKSFFWSAVKRYNTVRSRCHAQMIYGLSGERCTANYMASQVGESP